MKGNEDYDTISTAFAATFQEIDGLQQLGFVAVNGVSYNIELFFSSDMKVCDVMVLQACTFMFRMCYSSCSQCWALMQLTPFMHVQNVQCTVIAGKLPIHLAKHGVNRCHYIGGMCQSLNRITAQLWPEH